LNFNEGLISHYFDTFCMAFTLYSGMQNPLPTLYLVPLGQAPLTGRVMPQAPSMFLVGAGQSRANAAQMTARMSEMKKKIFI
jgi:hypothetical protein